MITYLLLETLVKTKMRKPQCSLICTFVDKFLTKNEVHSNVVHSNVVASNVAQNNVVASNVVAFNENYKELNLTIARCTRVAP
jgi:hypothetical protein